MGTKGSARLAVCALVLPATVPKKESLILSPTAPRYREKWLVDADKPIPLRWLDSALDLLGATKQCGPERVRTRVRQLRSC